MARFNLTKFGIAGAAVVLIVGVFILMVCRSISYNQEHFEQRQALAENYAQGTYAGIKACGPVAIKGGFSAWISCVSQVLSSGQEAESAEFGLQAQQDMAEFAYITLWFSGITLISAIIGVIYVARTFSQTKRTADDAREIGEKQVRAYPSAIGVSYYNITNELPCLSVSVGNSGSSPALRMMCRGYISLCYQEEFEPGVVEHREFSEEITHGSQVSIPPNGDGIVRVHAIAFPDRSKRKIASFLKSAPFKRQNPYWRVQIFFDWSDVFGKQYTFHIDAIQKPSGIGPVSVGPLDKFVMDQPFEIEGQSESTLH